MHVWMLQGNGLRGLEFRGIENVREIGQGIHGVPDVRCRITATGKVSLGSQHWALPSSHRPVDIVLAILSVYTVPWFFNRNILFFFYVKHILKLHYELRRIKSDLTIKSIATSLLSRLITSHEITHTYLLLTYQMRIPNTVILPYPVVCKRF